MMSIERKISGMIAILGTAGAMAGGAMMYDSCKHVRNYPHARETQEIAENLIAMDKELMRTEFSSLRLLANHPQKEYYLHMLQKYEKLYKDSDSLYALPEMVEVKNHNKPYEKKGQKACDYFFIPSIFAALGGIYYWTLARPRRTHPL